MQISRTSVGIIFSAVAATAGFFMYQAAGTAADDSTPAIRAQLESGLFREKHVGSLPAFVNIFVPFVPQAPFGDWSQPWQDACEEASVLMAVSWARSMPLTPALAYEEIPAIATYEESVLGYHQDTNIEETKHLFTDFYHYQNVTALTRAVSVERIRQELARGNLVIVPLAGAVLARENLHFTSPPHYHMVVVRGYDDATQQFITNEPGTRFGNGFRYSYKILFEAIHDWTGSPETILEGGKAMLIVRPVLSDTIQ